MYENYIARYFVYEEKYRLTLNHNVHSSARSSHTRNARTGKRCFSRQVMKYAITEHVSCPAIEKAWCSVNGDNNHLCSRNQRFVGALQSTTIDALYCTVLQSGEELLLIRVYPRFNRRSSFQKHNYIISSFV